MSSSLSSDTESSSVSYRESLNRNLYNPKPQQAQHKQPISVDDISCTSALMRDFDSSSYSSSSFSAADGSSGNHSEAKEIESRKIRNKSTRERYNKT